MNIQIFLGVPLSAKVHPQNIFSGGNPESKGQNLADFDHYYLDQADDM